MDLHTLTDLHEIADAAAQGIVDRLETADFFGVQTILNDDEYAVLVNELTDVIVETVEGRS